MKNVELAWAAGIIDGEGCISISAKPASGRRISVYHLLVLKITMGHKETIEKLHDLFGVGSIHIQDHYGPNLNESWSWLATAQNARFVIGRVRPYLVTKAYEADLALEFMALPRQSGRRVLDSGVLKERERFHKLMRDAKPTARFRAA